jgi:hypothetical protein
LDWGKPLRTVILVLILAVVALIVAITTGFLDIRQTRGAQAPEISANGTSVTATGGQAPRFDVETGKVAVGTRPENVTVRMPTIEVQPPQANQAATTNATN